jgi:DNA-binding response OmpR family regulator
MSRPQPRASTQATPSGDAPARCPRILLVDDVQDNRDLAAELFEGEPWNVETADNVQDAWALMKRWHPDLVILDIQMPQLDGHQLCEAMRLKPEFDGVPVMFLTAEPPNEVNINHRLELYACDPVRKPINARLLREKVRSMIEQRAGDRGSPPRDP